MVSDKSEDEDEEGGFGSASGGARPGPTLGHGPHGAWVTQRRLPTTTAALHVTRGPPRRETGTGTERESGGRYQVPTT